MVASKKIKFELSWPTDDGKCKLPLRDDSNSVCSLEIRVNILVPVLSSSLKYSKYAIGFKLLVRVDI